MKIVAYCALHYGRPYLAAAMQSVVDIVDEFVILYSDHPSHNGGVASLPCPDNERDLYDIAATVAGRKLRWVKGDWRYENQQRGAIFEHAGNADVILTVDSDEVYQDGLAYDAVQFALSSPAGTIRLPFLHLWRSFKRGFIHDPAYPVRVTSPQKHGDTVTMPTDKRIWHCGYALPVEYMRYKWSGIHGHQSELRRDCNWLEDIYEYNRQTNCHPVGSEFWDAEEVPQTYLPTPLKYHPFAKLEVIP